MMLQLAQEASIDGRVFLIINSGDLKPARLASVYVIDTGLYTPDLRRNLESYEEQLTNTCPDALLRRAVSQADMPYSILRNQFNTYQHYVDNYQKDLSRTVDKSKSTGHSPKGFLLQADEDGHFQAEHLRYA